MRQVTRIAVGTNHKGRKLHAMRPIRHEGRRGAAAAVYFLPNYVYFLPGFARFAIFDYGFELSAGQKRYEVKGQFWSLNTIDIRTLADEIKKELGWVTLYVSSGTMGVGPIIVFAGHFDFKLTFTGDPTRLIKAFKAAGINPYPNCPIPRLFTAQTLKTFSVEHGIRVVSALDSTGKAAITVEYDASQFAPNETERVISLLKAAAEYAESVQPPQ